MERPANEQVEKFKDAARELGCDDDDARFRERVGKLVGKRKKGGDTPPEDS